MSTPAQALAARSNNPSDGGQVGDRGCYSHCALLKFIPNGRIGEPEDVAKAAVWLASGESDYVSGTTRLVNGRMSLYPEFREGG
jgi:NAD(P)-dependent dehydrogenase (short-subunit alcohol dehydrogenase family)